MVRKFVRDEIIRPRREEVADCCGDDDGDNRDQIFLDTILPYLDGTAKRCAVVQLITFCCYQEFIVAASD